MAPQDETSFGDILKEFEQAQHAADSGSQSVQGVVIKVTAEGVILDIGRKTEGVLPLDQAQNRDGSLNVKPGEHLLVTITGYGEQGYTLSRVQAARPKDFSSLQAAFQEKRTIVGTVLEAVKGGLRVDIGLRAFLPASRSGVREIAELQNLIGKEIQCRIVELNIEGEDAVVDRRVVLEEEARQARDRFFSNLREGDVVRGTVRSLTDFGAFLDLGGVDGLLHVSDMSWHRVSKPGDVVAVGDSLDVKILKIHADSKRISLGLKQLTPDPWTLAAEKYKVGDRVRGTVARLADYGAFVSLEPGVDGMVHVSEMSWAKKVQKPGDVVRVGDAVEVVVLGVNTMEKRIALGLKQALGDPWEDIDRKLPAGSVVEGPVISLQKFGAFVDLGDGIEGMIHIGDISRDKRLNHPKEVLSPGQVVKAQVLEVDKGKRRIRLGLKQLEPTSADTFIAEHKEGEVVTGRVVEVTGNRAKIEVGDGVHAICRLGGEAAGPAPARTRAPADIGALTAMLSARWKEGKGGEAGQREALKPGQIRTFRIASLNASQKRIDVELIS